VAFLSSTPDGGTGVHVVPFDLSSPPRLVTATPAADGSRPAWSPDATTIAFGGGGGARPDIYVVRVDGTGLEKLTTGKSAEAEPAWSPNGKRLAYFSDKDGGDEVWVMDADGGSPRKVTRSQWGSYRPAWSPDGRSIVYVRNALGHSELALVAPDGSGGSGGRSLTRVRGHKANEAPAW